MAALRKLKTQWLIEYHNPSDQRQALLGGLMTSATMVQKRQVFLRSYQFSRKKMTVSEKVNRSLVKIRRLITLKLRSVRRFRKVIWSKLRRFSLRRTSAATSPNCLC